jgi:hypothetical protein
MIKAPWLSLMSESCRIECAGISVVAELSSTKFLQSQAQIKSKPATELERQFDAPAEWGAWLSWVPTVINNIIFSIKDVHVRCEVPIGDARLALGVVIQAIESFPVDASGSPAFLSGDAPVQRVLRITGLSVYMQPDVREPGMGVIECFILKDFNLAGDARRNKSADIKTEVSVEVPDICLSLTAFQFLGLKRIREHAELLNRRKTYLRCAHPGYDRLPRSERSSGLWWLPMRSDTTTENAPFLRGRSAPKDLQCPRLVRMPHQ